MPETFEYLYVDEAESFQQPLWPNPTEVHAAVEELRSEPGLFTLDDVKRLRRELALIEQPVLQVGECVETFEMLTRPLVRERCAFAMDLRDHFEKSVERRTTLVMRGLGQFAKPRSSYRDEEGLIRWRGDAINGAGATDIERQPDPGRMLEGYRRVRQVVNDLRATSTFVAHEALLMPYEVGLLRSDSGVVYLSSAHFLWIGNRTRSLSTPQSRLIGTIANPVGIKIDAACEANELLGHIGRLGDEPGRVTVIVRMGAANIEKSLTKLLLCPEIRGLHCRWLCDPLHGNQRRDGALGRTNRPMSKVLAETRLFCQVLLGFGISPGGLHLEASPFSQSECTGGQRRAVSLAEARSASPLLDPRLNLDQAKDVIDAFATSVYGRL